MLFRSESAEYSTVAGLLNVLFSGIPEVGQTIKDAAYEFRIVKRSRGSVDTVLLKLLPEEPEASADESASS